jgi:Ca2+-binding RTX toxin-like protein
VFWRPVTRTRRLGSLWLAALALTLAAASPAAATYPGQNGRIAFVKNPGPSFSRYVASIYTIAPAGGEPVNLSGTNGEDQAPSWSASGDRVIFERRHQGGPSIYTILADGTGERYVGPGLEPALSPDGATIAFVNPVDYRIFAMDADGSDARPLTTGWGWDPEYSPDGSLIALETQAPGGVFSIALMKADGSELRDLARGGSPSFSPDGTKIAYAYNGNIRVIGADGTGDAHLVSNASAPAYSPDGTKLAYQRYDEEDGPQLLVADADGSDERVMASFSAAPLGAEPDWQPAGSATPTPPTPAPPCDVTRTGRQVRDKLVGTPQGDLIRALGGNDSVEGGDGDDCLDGGRGDDRLRGGYGNDRVDGSFGADSIAGGPGLDRLRGGDGNDRIDARDLTAEAVSCGRGRDFVRLGPGDRATGCERVIAPSGAKR